MVCVLFDRLLFLLTVKGNKQPEVKNILLGSSLSTHPLFAENMSGKIDEEPICNFLLINL